MPPSRTEPAADVGQAGLAAAQALMDEADGLRQAGRFDEAVLVSLRAVGLQVDLERTLPALARAMEAQGDFTSALEVYRQAMALEPDRPAISGDMGRLALRMGIYDLAEDVLILHMRMAPPAAEAIANLALAQAMLKAFDRAHGTLKAALEADESEPLLWLTLAQVLCFEGRHAQAIVFFEEALRFDPASTPARDGLADALLLGVGDVERALALSEAALAGAVPDEVPALTAAHARRLLAAGRLEEGWTAFAKWIEPGEAAAIEAKIAAPLWTPGMALDGRLLLIGEEGIAEAALLAQVIPSVIADGTPVILSFGPGWESLARRSFPEATIVPLLTREQAGKRQQTADLDSPHVHCGELVAAWAPLRWMMKDYRAATADFADAPPYLKVDGGRIDHWRERLSALGPGLKVGVVWRAPSGDRGKTWEAPPLPLLKAGLSASGVHLIGVQEEMFLNELGWIRETFGLQIHSAPPELRPGDLDDLAALTLALDVVVGPPDGTACLAAACGAETWFLVTPRHWALLGAETFPWFPKAKVISAAAPDDWADAMTNLQEALEALAGTSASR
jgi:Tfp pilus assembly protein PilF